MTQDPAQVLSLPIAEIDPAALIRDRTRLNEEALAELMISIAGTGLRQPIEVWAFPEPFESLCYGLISGARRLTVVGGLLAWKRKGKAWAGLAEFSSLGRLVVGQFQGQAVAVALV